jgi:hypothetical protein
MTVAAIPARDWAISAEPSWSSIFIGIAFHQWADFSWAVVFFPRQGCGARYRRAIRVRREIAGAVIHAHLCERQPTANSV